MPIITLESATLNIEQKKQLAEELTSSVAKILKTPEESVIILLKENLTENIGKGGKLISDN